MFFYIWPIALVVLSNLVYQICAKSVPDGLNPFAALAVTYTVGAAVSIALYFIMNNKNANLIGEFSKLNWAPFLMGLVVVGLEVGFIYAYKAGWQVSMAALVSSTVLAVLLIFVGYLLYKESITWNKILGIVICLAGLFFINFKFK